MGPASAPGRILSALFGCVARLRLGRAAGRPPGQLALAEIFSRSTEVDRPRPIEALFGIVGARRLGLARRPGSTTRSSAPRDLPLLYLPAAGRGLRARASRRSSQFDPPFRGFSVTRPWKLRAARDGRPVRGRPRDRRREHARLCARAVAARRIRTWTGSSIRSPTTTRAKAAARSSSAPAARRAAVVAARKLGYEVTGREPARRARRTPSRRSWTWIRSPGRISREDRGGPLLQRDTDRFAARRTASAFPAERAGEPSARLRLRLPARRVSRRRRSARRARRGCPTVEGIRMFAAQAVRQARLFGVDDVDAGRRSRADCLRTGMARGDGVANDGAPAANAGTRSGDFLARARSARVVPVGPRVSSDALTPVTLFRRMRRIGAGVLPPRERRGRRGHRPLHVPRAAARRRA